MQRQDYPRAAEHLKAARANQPADATVAYELGQALVKTGKFEDARDALEASLKLIPGQLAARILLGHVYLQLKNPAAAADQFEAALLVDAKNAQAKAGLVQARAANH